MFLDQDTITAKSMLTLDDQFYAMRQDHDRIWSPTVMIQIPIGIVWVSYDIYVNGRFPHCEVDSFSLIKTYESWKNASMVFTMKTDTYADSPLGPIK